MGRTILVLGLVVMFVALTGCACPRIRRANDELRRTNLELQNTIHSLRESLELREAQLQRRDREVRPPPPLVEDAQVPELVRLRFDRLTGAVDTTRDGRPDLIRVYLRPQDQRGRFLLTAGQAVVQAVGIPAVGEPVTIARREYAPEQFDQAYRTGITGTHYTLELPLPDPLPQGLRQVTVQVEFTEARTADTLVHQQVVELR